MIANDPQVAPPSRLPGRGPGNLSVKIAFVAVAVAVAMLSVASCGSITKSSGPTTTAPGAPASTKAAPSPSNSLSGPVGTVYTVTDPSGDKMSVTLTKVIDPAQGADQFTTPDNGNRFVGTVFSINGMSGTFSDDANNDATLIGSNGQTYTADFDSIAGYTNFNDGEYTVGPGENSVGAVTFRVPVTVKLAKIEWSANGGFGGAPAEWLVRAPATSSAAGTAGAASSPLAAAESSARGGRYLHADQPVLAAAGTHPAAQLRRPNQP